MVGVPGREGFRHPQAGAVAEASGDNPINVLARGDPDGYRFDDPIPDLQGEHKHLGYWTVGIAMEGGAGNH